MDNNFQTGKPHLDIIVLCIAWLLAFINWGFVVGLLSSMASIFVNVSKGQEIIDRYRNNRKRRKIKTTPKEK